MKLYLQIKRKWFDKIVTGNKKEDYRGTGEYYQNRLFDIFPENKYSEVVFVNGYRRDAPTARLELLGVEIRNRRIHPDLGEPDGPHFVIRLGNVLDVCHWWKEKSDGR